MRFRHKGVAVHSRIHRIVRSLSILLALSTWTSALFGAVTWNFMLGPQLLRIPAVKVQGFRVGADRNLRTLSAVPAGSAGGDVDGNEGVVNEYTDSAPRDLWDLQMNRIDHYIWRDPDVFVGIVTDAGDWTLDVDRVRAAYEEAKRQGTATIFSAPSFVVKDYVRELENFGLSAFAVQSTTESGKERNWARRDWRSLSPEAKETQETAGARPSADEVGRGNFSVFITSTDHPTLLSNDATSRKKFRAYVELAADVANAWAPAEDDLDKAHSLLLKIGQAAVFIDLPLEAADVAAQQFRKSGFVAEVKPLVSASSS